MSFAERCASVLVLAGVLFAGVPSSGAAADRPDRATFAGRTYVRLSTWARANEFVIRWIERDRTLQLSNRVARLVFVMNSREAQFDGVKVWLSFPLIYQGGTAYISQLDLDKAVGPVLVPPVNVAGLKVRTICLDPGHGGSDPGNRAGRNSEQHYTLLLALELKQQLIRAGFNVILTRSNNTYVGLPTRPAIARQRKADLFVSLHFNSTASSQNVVKGVEVFCCTPAGATSTNAGGEGSTSRVTGNNHDSRNLLLAYHVQKAAVRRLGTEDRGVRRGRWQVLRDAQMPAILVEGGFMSHPAEGKKIVDPAYRRQMAQAIVEGIVAYKRAVKG